MTVVHEQPAHYIIEDGGGLAFGPFTTTKEAYTWALSRDGVGLPFTIKEVWTPSDRR